MHINIEHLRSLVYKRVIVELDLSRQSSILDTMKVFTSLLILASLAATIYGKDVPESVAMITKGLHQVCVSESGVAEEIILKARAGEFSEQREFKCYVHCLFEKLNLVSKSGVFNFDGMISIAPEDLKEEISKIINSCRDVELPESDKCERAFSLNTCLYDANPAEYFLI